MCVPEHYGAAPFILSIISYILTSNGCWTCTLARRQTDFVKAQEPISSSESDVSLLDPIAMSPPGLTPESGFMSAREPIFRQQTFIAARTM